MIDGSTQLVGLVGWPVEHSLSPAMHNAVFEAVGLNLRCVPLPVYPGELEAAVGGLAALGFRGANVTVPHRQTVMRFLDILAPSALAVGAVNTLVISRDPEGAPVISGYNTDERGFVGALREGGFEPAEGGAAVVLGAGGSARAAVHGLLWSGGGDIAVLDRTPGRAETLVSEMAAHADYGRRLRALPLTTETLVESAGSADLLVNAAPVGVPPHTQDTVWPESIALPPHLTVFDLVQSPHDTRLLHLAREAGARTIDGLSMLVQQGALSLAMWTEVDLEEEEIRALMRSACEAAPRT